jgi:hypothetical protein
VSLWRQLVHTIRQRQVRSCSDMWKYSYEQCSLVPVRGSSYLWRVMWTYSLKFIEEYFVGPLLVHSPFVTLRTVWIVWIDLKSVLFPAKKFSANELFRVFVNDRSLSVVEVFDNLISIVPVSTSATEIGTARTFGAETFKESVVQVLTTSWK